MPAPPCKPNCKCGKHLRTTMHNKLIAQSVKKTIAAKKKIDKERVNSG